MQQNNVPNLSQSKLKGQQSLLSPNSSPKSNNKIAFASMLKTQDQLKKKEDYFTFLINNHPLKLETVSSFLTSKAEQFNTEILEGKYEIKPRLWSAEQELNRDNERKKSSEAFHVKKNLENQLKDVENQLQEEQRQKSRAISEEERISFMKKIENQKKELLKKRQQAAKLEQQQRLEQQRRLKEQKEHLQLQKKNKKRKEIEETLRIMEQQHKKRQQLSKQQELVLKEKLKQRTMVDKIQEQYNLKQNESLEEKKKRLAEIRMLHKPISRNQLDQFAQKVDQLQRDKMAERTSTLQKAQANSSQIFYKSAFYKKVEKQQKMFEDSKNEDELTKLKQARDKLKKFSEHVKTAYKPAIDDKLVEEMKFRSVNLSKRGRSISHTATETPQKIGLRYLEFSKLQIDHQKLLVSGEQEAEEEKEEKVDYLAELRRKNKRREIKSAQDLLEQMEKMNLSKEEKQQKVMEFTQRLEKKAKQREHLEKIGRSGVDDQLDALYLEAIEAKLSLLDDI